MRLRTKLETYIAAHPGFDLVKMLHSGSVAKGTALRTINDMDVAVYVTAGKAPQDEKKLIAWLTERLQKAYGDTLKPEQFSPQHHCVTVSFKGSGLDVDVVPVLYEGGADDRGYLITEDTGDRVLTSIPLHLKFTRTRKEAHKRHYRQMVRLVKWWAGIQKNERDNFRFKSFMIELLLAHLFDNGLDGSDYPEALFAFFSYIVRTRLGERIVFSDYYDPSKVVAGNTMPIQIYDPVNPENNIAALLHNGSRRHCRCGRGRPRCYRFRTPRHHEGRRRRPVADHPRHWFQGGSMSLTITQTRTWTITQARYVTSKIATDLDLLRTHYGRPSADKVTEFGEEAALLLAARPRVGRVRIQTQRPARTRPEV